MKKQREFDDNIVRSGTRVRESVRSLPKGHFQQIRQMFEKQTYSTKTLSTIYERQQKPILNDVLLRLPVTDDEKLKHTITNINDIKINHNKSSLEQRYRDYLAEYQTFHLKLTNEFLQHKIMYPLKPNEHSFKKSISLSHENNLNQETLSHTTSLTEQQLPLSKLEESILTTSQLNKQRQLAMAAIINYTDSYDSLTSNSLKCTGSSRQYVSSLQSTSDVHTKPGYLTTPTTCNLLKDNQPMISNETYNILKSSRRLRSSTSLSSTGYDSNSSPSIKSKRNSIATNNSNDFIIQSTCSSSPTSSSSSSSACPLSSSDEQQQQLLKPWIQYQSNTIKPSNDNDDVFESSNESSSSPLISRTEIKLNQSTIDSRPTNVIRHAVIRNSTLIDSPSSTTTTSTHEPIIATKKNNNLPYIVQTTSFPDHTIDRKIRRWNNVYGERIEIVNKSKRNRKYPLLSTNSMGFQVMSSNNEQQQIEFDTLNTNSEQKKIYQQEENSSSLVETSVLCRLPPKKPPRTFENDRKNDHLVESNSQKVPSPAVSNENSPTFDRGTRSISCMDLTASVSNVLLSNDHQHDHNSRQSSIVLEKTIKISIPNENFNEPLTSIIKKDTQEQYLYNSSHSELDTTNKNNLTFHTPIIKPKQHNILTTKKNSSMKKGISEPNLRKTSRNRSPFSPRALIDRFKRMLPLTLSKQSLNDKIINHTDNISTMNDSDDTASTSSENTDHLRTSRLDHVSRVKDVYDSLNTSNHMSSLLTDPNISIPINELKTLYDYVVHIIPEQELGYFSNGNGCLLSSNINQQQQQQQQYISTSTSIRFKYPLNANDEVTLKYFCFPDQNDSNNNPLLVIKTITQEYFRFTLTNMYGIRQYGYCSRFYHKGIINALCIVSPYDMIDVYEKILSTATELFLSYKDNDARKFLEEIYQHHLPNRGDTIHISTTTVGLYTLKCEYDRRKVLIDSITFLSLSTDTIIKVFSSILYEQKIIFIGNELGPLTRLINTFICLLYPFSWPHTYVPILPSLMLDVIQAPTPYIIGILRSCESYLTANDDFLLQDNSDILIIDIDHDRIRSINDYLTNNTYRSSIENLHSFPLTHVDTTHFQILPKIFKIELKQEISLLRKTRLSLSLDECQQRLHNVFMSIFVQSCYNYKDYYNEKFQYQEFLQSKQHTIELFLEWFTHTQIFELFIRQKFENNNSNQYAITFDLACEKYSKTLNKQITPQRITVKSVKRKSATRANKQENKF